MSTARSASLSGQGKRQYRADIDGLRALAVVPVVLFHAGIPGISGGFVGVDIFFVISGYLITGILFEEGQQGHVSIFGFYERRIRRIAPVFFSVMIASTIAAHLLLFPSQYIDYAKSMLATEGFVSNIWFWRSISYFTASETVRPLLHTWSLSVEEQFYLFVPIIIALTSRKNRLLRLIILGLALLSFLLCYLALLFSPDANFYLIPTRAWELLVGSLLATGWLGSPRTRWAADVLGYAGLGLILLAMLFFTEQSPFPGPLALLPVFGSAAVIHASRIQQTNVSRALSYSPLIMLGQMSYSLYLWHWPIIAFARQYVGGEFSTWQKAACVVASFGAAALSWRYIEVPTRDRKMVSSRTLIAASAAVTIVLAVWAGAVIIQGGLRNRYSPDVLILADGANNKQEVPIACGWTMIDASCRLGSKGKPDFILAGDSFAGALAPAVDYAAGVRSGLLTSFNSCPALLNWDPPRRAIRMRQACQARNKALFERVRIDPNIHTLIIANRVPATPSLDAALQRTAKFVHDQGKSFVVLEGIPDPGFDVPWALAVDRVRGRSERLIMRPTTPTYAALQKKNFRSIDLSVALCQSKMCRLTFRGRPIFYDSGHLSLSTSRDVVGPYLARSGLFRLR